MTIKDIAKAANVSAATVSRIINHKDENISQETRERVLRIIAENDYVPYAKIRDRILAQSRSIGLVVPTLNSEFYVHFASRVQQLAQEKNYSMVLALSSGSADAERTALENFSRNRADGIILFSGSGRTSAALQELYSQGVGVVALDHFARPAAVPQIYRDSAQVARDCVRFLAASNCSQIGLVLQPDCMAEVRDAIRSGYAEALAAAGIPLQQNLIISADDSFVESFRSMADAGLDGIVCQDADVARLVYSAASMDELRIPEDISVVSMEDSSDSAIRLPALTAAATDVQEMADLAFSCLLSQIEHSPLPFSSRKVDCAIRTRDSVRSRNSANPRILVSGYLNTDVLLRTPTVPKMGKTQVTSHIVDCVGGRGANQAYGVSKLGGNAYLLGRLGSDRRGRFIHDQLSRAGVKMDGVSFDGSHSTGAAYISLYPNGKSSVLIDPGANVTTDPAYIRAHEQLIRESSLCLAQTDIPLESVSELHRLCRLHGIPMILRPSYGVRLPESLVAGLYILIMKEQERQLLYPEFSGMEECAAWFRSLGAEHVIFTDGISGCCWFSDAGCRNYPGYNYPCIDETGTSDVFIGCLATLLGEHFPMENAIHAATWAAAYSATRLGVQNGFPDRKLLEDVVFGGLELRFPESAEE